MLVKSVVKCVVETLQESVPFFGRNWFVEASVIVLGVFVVCCVRYLGIGGAGAVVFLHFELKTASQRSTAGAVVFVVVLKL